jgi:hypothetical protein
MTLFIRKYVDQAKKEKSIEKYDFIAFLNPSIGRCNIKFESETLTRVVNQMLASIKYIIFQNSVK